MLSRFIFRQLRRRAYSSEEFVRMAETSPFGGAELRKSDIGFDVVLTKAAAGHPLQDAGAGPATTEVYPT